MLIETGTVDVDVARENKGNQRIEKRKKKRTFPPVTWTKPNTASTYPYPFSPQLIALNPTFVTYVLLALFLSRSRLYFNIRSHYNYFFFFQQK